MKIKLSSILIIISVFLLLDMPLYASDSDGDGIDDSIDNCRPIANGPQKGTCTAGTKGGETCTKNEDCGPGGFCSMNQEDADGDGYGDACDYCAGNGQYDIDADGLCDGEDNCPYVPNPDQKDSDGDGKGDVCINSIPKFSRPSTFKGSYREIGQQAAHTYRDSIIYVANSFNGLNYLSAQSYYDLIQDLIPESIKQHMEGMAFGLTEVSPLSYTTAWNMVVLNSFGMELINEILNTPQGNSLSAADEAEETVGCTAFALASKDGVFLAHNTDNSKGTENVGAVLYIRPDNGDNSYIHIFSPAFADASLALNDKGIGITYNLGKPNTNWERGLPVLFMVRYVMEKAKTLEEAVNYFTDFLDDKNHNYGSAGAIFLLVDFKDSSMAKLQVRSGKIKVTYGQELKAGVTYVATTNHFDENFRDDPNFYYESSFKRFDRLMELLPTYETYDLNTCWKILSDHGDGLPDNNTISRNGTTTGTTVSNVFTADTVYYTLGMPHAYLEAYGEPVAIDFKKMVNQCPMEALYGEDSEEVKLLRAFRDNVLSKSQKGKQIMKLYYALSPAIAQWLEKNRDVQEKLKNTIDRMQPVIRAAVK